MANSAGSRKRARQAVNRRSHNASLRSMVRAAIDTKNYDDAQAALTAAAPFVDKMVTKGIMHKNKAARVKSRLNAAVVALKG